MNKVYRFHRPAQDLDVTAPYLLRKRKAKRSQEFYYLAADERTITDANGTRPIEEFQNLRDYSAVTLTRREADLIALANPGARPPTALEDMHPWLPRRSFVPVSAIGYRSLMQLLAKYGQHLTSASIYCDLAWNTACNTLRYKTSLDRRFQVAWHLPIQDVFVLEEKRPGRSVIAIDVNAMYSACMQHEIPHPAAICKIEFGRDYLAGEELAAGLYRCQLSGASTEFIHRHNPFTTFFCGRRLRAPLHETIEVDLNEFEVIYYSQHFVRIHILDAVVASKVIPHPLAREARRTFARRKNYRIQNNKPLADREKYLATLLSSCGNRPANTTKVYIDRSRAMAYLSDTHGISPSADEPEAATNMWISRSKRVVMTEALAGTRVVSPDQNDRSTCFMLTQRIVAHGRIHLLQLMERVLALNSSVDICYVNIDSVHFSVPTEKLDEILEFLRAEASEEMGAFKIEAVTKHGLWLEPGKYWLYSNSVEKFRNRSIRVGATQPFQDRSFHVVSRQIDDLHIPIRVIVRMNKSMSHVRTLHQDNDGFVRQKLVERGSASSFSETLDMLENNRRLDTVLRLEAFQKLKRWIDQACSAASEQT